MTRSAPTVPPSLADTSSESQEIELKLRVAPDALERLLQAPPIVNHQRNRGQTRHMATTYFDTKDGLLAGHGWSLRVRRIGRQYRMTLKSPGDRHRSALARDEWEVPVPDDRPHPDLLPDDAPLTRLGTLLPEELRPVYRAEMRRRLRLLDWREEGGEGALRAVVEAAFDDGRLLAGERTAPVSELELELKGGAPAALYRLALALHAQEPVQVETRSKAERAQALADDRPPGWTKAGKSLAVTADQPVCAVLETVLRQCYGHWLANQAAAADGRDPEGVHQMRVALRRLRSALALFRPVLADDHFDWLDREAKWLADALGPARDWDVFIAELLPPVTDASPGDPALACLAETARREQARGYVRVRAALEAPRTTAFILELGAWIESRGWRDGVAGPVAEMLDQPIRSFADPLLDRLHRKALKRGRGFADLPVEQRHRVRIALKKLRYAVEFFLEIYPGKRSRRFRRALEGMQEALGHLNDVAAAHSLLERLSPAPEDPAARLEALRLGGGMVIGWHQRGLVIGEAEIVSHWRRFSEAEPFWRRKGR